LNKVLRVRETYMTLKPLENMSPPFG
jgi:hypothetical protein